MKRISRACLHVNLKNIPKIGGCATCKNAHYGPYASYKIDQEKDERTSTEPSFRRSNESKTRPYHITRTFPTGRRYFFLLTSAACKIKPWAKLEKKDLYQITQGFN